MKKWILILAVLLGFAACQKPYQTTITLGVNNEQIVLKSFEEGHCYITVFSNGGWTIALEPAVDWARLDRESGEGIAYVRMDYDENFGSEERYATVVVSGQGKECQILITQPAE